jgi:hypothetical protein
MAKSAYEAINAIEKSTEKTPNPIKKFVVTGASKRGWTTWLVAGTGDKRIIGIAPVVFDNLNMVAQMKHQKDLWGHYSPQIQDYEKSGMLAALETPDGKQIAAMLDPLTYAGRIKCPLFSINGTNDPFWAPDAMSLYWDKLKMPKSCLFLPNEGHTFKHQNPYIESLGAFASSCSGEFKWPKMWSKMEVAKGQIIGRIARFEGIQMSENRTFPKLLPISGLYYCESVLGAANQRKWILGSEVKFDPTESAVPQRKWLSKKLSFPSVGFMLRSRRFGRHVISVSSRPRVFYSK